MSEMHFLNTILSSTIRGRSLTISRFQRGWKLNACLAVNGTPRLPVGFQKIDNALRHEAGVYGYVPSTHMAVQVVKENGRLDAKKSSKNMRLTDGPMRHRVL